MKPRTLFLGCVAMLLLNSAGTFAKQDRDKTYRCDAKDAVSIMHDGTLNKLIAKSAIEIFDKVVVDVSSGHITYPSSGKREEWTVAQTNANENDYVLFRSSSRRLINNKAVADAVTRFIRIRATAGEQPRFMAYGLSYLVTGTCAVVQ